MKIAVKTPTSAVTARATVGSGDVSPKFCKIKVQKYCYSFAILLIIARKGDQRGWDMSMENQNSIKLAAVSVGCIHLEA